MSANPQLENGYTSIANEIMDALCKIRIPGEAMQVLLFILRKTYGWNKKEDRISLSQFAVGTGLKKTTICKSLRKLEDMRLIITKKGKGITQFGNEYSTSYCFNKIYLNWVPLPKKVKGITQFGKNHYPIGDIQKQVTKDTKQKQKKTSSSLRSDVSVVERDSFNRFYDLYPRKVGRAAAEKAWHKIWQEHGDAITEKIIDAINKQVIAGHLRLDENKKYCPHPATWLNQGRWDDEIAPADKRKWNLIWE